MIEKIICEYINFLNAKFNNKEMYKNNSKLAINHENVLDKYVY